MYRDVVMCEVRNVLPGETTKRRPHLNPKMCWSGEPIWQMRPNYRHHSCSFADSFGKTKFTTVILLKSQQPTVGRCWSESLLLVAPACSCVHPLALPPEPWGSAAGSSTACTAPSGRRSRPQLLSKCSFCFKPLQNGLTPACRCIDLVLPTFFIKSTTLTTINDGVHIFFHKISFCMHNCTVFVFLLMVQYFPNLKRNSEAAF